jgi:uncharacterized protein (DUF4415 family)
VKRRNRSGKGKSSSGAAKNRRAAPDRTEWEGVSSTGTDEWVGIEIVVPPIKQPISFRVDPDVLDFFKQQGPRYQTRMNAVLRAYMSAHGEEGQE